jgi:hypothetical protein
MPLFIFFQLFCSVFEQSLGVNYNNFNVILINKLNLFYVLKFKNAKTVKLIISNKNNTFLYCRSIVSFDKKIMHIFNNINKLKKKMTCKKLL